MDRMVKNMNDRNLLNNGIEMPCLGFGAYRMKGEEVEGPVKMALEAGYRSIDTATFYQNEREIGKAIRESGIPREEIFLTTKVWNDDLRQKRTMEAFNESLERLGTDYMDLYLIHWPVEGYYHEAWRVLEEISRSGRAKAIGLSNFTIRHIEDVLGMCEIKPAVNQVEFHPRLVQLDLLKYCNEQDILLEAWSPLMQGKLTEIGLLRMLAEKYGRSPAQIVLRWNLQHGVATIPKSANPQRIVENTQLFDFELSQTDMSLIDALDEGMRLGPDPDNVYF